jgi:hypothetical protein
LSGSRWICNPPHRGIMPPSAGLQIFILSEAKDQREQRTT